MARAPKESADNSSAKPDKLAEARGRNLDLAIQQIQKDYGEGAILRMGGEGGGGKECGKKKGPGRTHDNLPELDQQISDVIS